MDKTAGGRAGAPRGDCLPSMAMFHEMRRLSRLFPLAIVLALPGCGSDSSSPTGPVVPISRVVVSPAVDTVGVDQFAQFSATAFDTLGNPAPGVGFHWTSGDPQIFSVTSGGRVEGVSEGTAPLIVEAQGLRDTAWVTVVSDPGWFRQPSGTSAELNAVFFQPDGRNGVAVGNGGTIIRTTDGGASWTRPPSGTSFNLNGVWFTGDTEGWAVGNGGTVMHTVDGGQTWARDPFVYQGDALYDVRFASRDLGWVVGASGLILRTSTGGLGWYAIRLPTSFSLRGVSFTGALDGWAVGGGGVIAGTHDGGLTWFMVPTPTVQGLEDVWQRSLANAWAVGSQGVTPRTVATPDSVEWELQTAGPTRQLNGVHFPTDLIGYAVGYDAMLGGTVLRTEDGGVTWQAQASRSSARLNDVFFIDPLHGWAVGEGGTVIHTANGGSE